jgi:hydroxymethylpyrimidine kinase/phosphomethylpyrimidine kinase/thiamine-phosphate diphosphorylase
MSDSHLKNKPTVICIAATDPMGLSGIHADLRALDSMGVHGLACITATTAQNENGFYQLNPVSDDAFLSQLNALADYSYCDVIKIGLLANSRQAELLLSHSIIGNKKIIFDPVLAASSGDIDQYDDRLKGLLALLPVVSLLTPNYHEALSLLELDTTNAAYESIEKMAVRLIEKGAQAILLKGGHSGEVSLDFYCEPDLQFYLKHDAFDHGYSRGTGCAMASLVAASLALGASMGDAVTMAKMQMHGGWKSPFKLSDKSGSLGFEKWVSPEVITSEHVSNSHDTGLKVSLPTLYKNHNDCLLSFKPCRRPLGLYPIFDRAAWLKRLLPLGINIAQLRIKDLTGSALRSEIQMAVNIAKQYSCQLFINDHWQLAIECGAYGVHLGQEDIDTADLQAISDGGLRLGLSSHCFYEVARAKTINPSYIAFGPVFATQSKDMPWIPQGLAGLNFWRPHLAEIPMVAIGGIHGGRFDQVRKTGVEAIAMISAITQAPSPESAVRQYLQGFS